MSGKKKEKKIQAQISHLAESTVCLCPRPTPFHDGCWPHIVSSPRGSPRWSNHQDRLSQRPGVALPLSGMHQASEMLSDRCMLNH